MIFTPYSDESKVINMIRRFRNEDYSLVRMTYTMIDKNNLDANGILRDLLSDWGLVDYEQLENGGSFGITYDAYFIQNGKTDVIKLKFYKVANNRGDRRFSIEKLKRKMENGEILVWMPLQTCSIRLNPAYKKLSTEVSLTTLKDTVQLRQKMSGIP